MHDPISRPSHYADTDGIECIDAIEASMNREGFKGFLKGNIQKYVWRHEKKNGSEDLKKAQWYLNRLIIIREMEEAMVRALQENIKETISINYDPDAYMVSGCPNGFSPLPNVRQGPPETVFDSTYAEHHSPK